MNPPFDIKKFLTDRFGAKFVRIVAEQGKNSYHITACYEKDLQRAVPLLFNVYKVYKDNGCEKLLYTGLHIFSDENRERIVYYFAVPPKSESMMMDIIHLIYSHIYTFDKLKTILSDS